MNQKRGVLCLDAAPFRAAQSRNIDAQRLIFNENEPLLCQAQTALWEIRRRCGWVCVAAEGERIAAAVALAAQLPVDRLALKGGWLYCRGEDRKARRLKCFARRNLPLVVSDVLWIGAPEREARVMVRSRRHGDLRILPEQDWESCADLLVGKCNAGTEKTCLIQ